MKGPKKFGRCAHCNKRGPLRPIQWIQPDGSSVVDWRPYPHKTTLGHQSMGRCPGAQWTARLTG